MPAHETPNRDPAPIPGPQEVRAELGRVLSSQAFEQAGRASQFLRFVVEEALAGRSERLKGYAIAVAVFDRPDDFDAQADPVVRVEAGRLRRRLMEYYLAEGHHDTIRIELPRGGYVPRFRYAAPPATDPDPNGEAPATVLPLRGGWPLAAAALLLAVLVLSVWQLSRRSDEPLSLATAGLEAPHVVTHPRPRLLVLPLDDLSGDPNLSLFSRGLTDEILSAFVYFGILEVASPATRLPASTSLASLRAQFDAGYALTGNIRLIDDRVRLSMRLIETDSGTQLWARAFDEPLAQSEDLSAQQNLAHEIGVMLASPYGPVFAHEIARTAGRATESLNPFECVLRFYGYVETLDVAVHADARACLQRTVEEVPDYAEAWAGLATLHLHEHVYGFNPLPDAPPPLERALEAARRSLDLDGSGRAVAVTLIGIRHAAGDDAGFERAIERALEIVPPHPAILAHVGFLLTLSGDWERGIPMLDQAIPLTANPPQWLMAAYAFRYLETEDYAEALDAALRMDAPNWFVAPMTVAAAAALADRPDIAERETARLLALYPSFSDTGREQLERWRMSKALEATIIAGLEHAGLKVH
jgi:TolB-like protein